MNYKKIKIPAIVLSFGIIMGLAFIFFTNPSEPDIAPVLESSIPVTESSSSEIEESEEPLPEVEEEIEEEPEDDNLGTINPGIGYAPEVIYVPSRIEMIYYDGKEIESMHSLYAGNATYHKIPDTKTINKVITELKDVTKKSETVGDSGVLINFSDGTRDNILFNEKDYPSLAKICDTNNKNEAGTVEWLTYMNADKILSVRFSGNSNRAEIDINTADRDAITDIANHLKTITTVGKSEIHLDGIRPPNPGGALYYYNMDIVFPTGEYNISGHTGELRITSSHMPEQLIVYKVSYPSIEELMNICERISNNNTYQQNPIASDSKRMHIYNNDTKTFKEVERISENSLNSHLNTLTPMKKDDLGKALSGFNRLEVVDTEDKKFVYDIYENGFTVQGTGVENMDIEEAYKLERWSDFNSVIKTATQQEKTGAYWLGLMSDDKISSVLIQEDGTPSQASATKVDGSSPVRSAIYDLRYLEVESKGKILENKSGNSAQLPKSEDFTTVFVNFNNDIVYTIFVSADELIVHSSDMTYSLGYTLESGNTSAQCMLDLLKPPSPTYWDPSVEANPPTGKPVIYLYPEKTMDISVKLDFDGEIAYTYPTLNDGWEVTATPESVITNKNDNSLHYYLFWDGIANEKWEYEKGSVVKSEDTEEFLVKALSEMGLTPKEYNDFIVFWVPLMQSNPYNLISFSGDEYEDIAKLTINPKPDSVLRVHMMFKALDKPIEIEPQVFTPFERKGFTVVEWGGTDIS